MIDGILRIGNKIEMNEIDRNLGGKPKENSVTYVSQILEFDEDDENVINIAMPIMQGKIIPLEVGKQFELFFFAGKGMYTAVGVIENRYKSDNIYVLVMRLLTDIKKHQRRQYFRLDINIEIKYKEFSEEEEKYFRLMNKLPEEMIIKPYASGVTIDISGGGSKFVAKDRLLPGDKVWTMLNLANENGITTVEMPAKVVASIPARGRSDLFENRIEFFGIKDKDREVLIKYIFTQERNQRKKKLE